MKTRHSLFVLCLFLSMAPFHPTLAASTSTAPENSAKSKTPPEKTKQAETLAFVPAEKSLHWLMNGNTRFTTKKLRADGKSPADRERLLGGERPHAIILACSDSRVAPELVFDQALGEILTIRVAGEALDASVIATIERAVETLGPRLIVVMGHTKCDAVDAALKSKEGAGGSDLERLLGDIRQRLKTINAEKISPNLEVESTVNADGVARDLMKRSEIVRKRVDAGELVIKTALYRLENGKVSFY